MSKKGTKIKKNEKFEFVAVDASGKETDELETTVILRINNKDKTKRTKTEEPMETVMIPLEEIHKDNPSPIDSKEETLEPVIVEEFTEEVSSEEIAPVDESVPFEASIEEDLSEENAISMDEVTPFEVDDDSNKTLSEEDYERELRLMKKIHFSFEARVIVMVLCILFLFCGACFLIIETIRYGKNEVVSYNETSNIGYNVCLFENNYYSQECLEEDMEYLSSLSKTIGAYFQYNVDFSTDITYNLAYHVTALTRIYDQDDPSKVLFRSEDTLLDKMYLNDTSNFISIDADVEVDYQKYNNTILEYQNRYSIASSADLELILYLDEETETRKVASIVVPLGNNTFGITKNVISNKNQQVEIDGDFWSEYNIICAAIASVLIILSLFLLFRTARLVLKVTTNRNKYQQRLSQILRDYDRIIVIARNGYESNVDRQIVKVESFEELLDARDTLQKPIIYSRINDVKSEFIVEDDTTLYRYVLKEADL